jgi:hypothetical protein
MKKLHRWRHFVDLNLFVIESWQTHSKRLTIQASATQLIAEHSNRVSLYLKRDLTIII